MKKIFIILLLGISFTQINVSSKNITIPLSLNTTEINIQNYIDLMDNELYTFEPFFISEITTDCEFSVDSCENIWDCEGWDIEFTTIWWNENYANNQSFDFDYSCDNNEDSEFACKYWFEETFIVINQENSILNTNFSEFLDLGCATFTGNLHVRVTGVFEDDLMPDTGDLNLDGEINVVDVVVLVNSILGIG